MGNNELRRVGKHAGRKVSADVHADHRTRMKRAFNPRVAGSNPARPTGQWEGETPQTGKGAVRLAGGYAKYGSFPAAANAANALGELSSQ